MKNKHMSRNTDPVTSMEAADAASVKGSAVRQRHLCLEVVLNEPGLTAAEIAVKAGLERHAPSRRLPELRSKKKVLNEGARICTVTGNNSMTWVPWTAEAQMDFHFVV